MPKAQDDDLVMTLVELALSHPADTRENYVRTACAGDTELFTQVWDYVRWDGRMQDFLLDPLFPTLREHEFEPGELLAERFRIVREVARGGMGIVYEAQDERLGRRIALKCAKSGFRKRLPPEVRHASEISHPNVCKIFEIHTASINGRDVDFLTMEFLDGKTLAARLNAGKLPEAEARVIGRQICAGMAEAHRNGVVHGDLKSNNIILAQDADGGVRAVITDFGLARRPFGPAEGHGSGGPGVAGSSQAGGTPDYMAPELWKGEKATNASDVYALGVILYELAASHRPYAPDTTRQGRLQRKPPAVRRGWDPIVQKCLAADPAERFRDAGEVAAALEPSRALRWWLAAAAALLLAVVSGLITFQRATAPRESMSLALLPLDATPDAAALAEVVSRDAAAELAHLKGGKRARLRIIPLADVARRNVDSAAKARAELKATHIVSGIITRQDGRIVLHAFVTDTRTQVNAGDWKMEYAPAEIRYAGTALAGMVTSSLRLPALDMPPVKAKAQHDYQAGWGYTRRNSTVDKALPLLENAVAADPDSPLTWAALAEAQWFKYLITGDPAWLDKTSESLRQAQLRDLDLAPVHRVTGLLRANAGFYEQAEAEYQRAIELDPSNGDAYRRLGQVYELNNRPDQALAAFEKAAEVDPNNFKVYQDLGAYYSARGDDREAVHQLEKCVRLAPDEPDSHRVLGSAFQNLGRYPEAEHELRIAVGLAETPTSLGSLALALMYQGRDRVATQFLERAVSQSPGDSVSWMDLGIAYQRANLPKESQRAWRQGLEQAKKAMRRDPRDGVVRSRVAFLSARLGDRERAESEIAQALQLSPESNVTKGAAVWTYEALGQRNNALTVLRTSSDDVLLDAARWPDLADLHQDSRFQQLLASRQAKK
jgi:serine/threonine protein kinase/Flp pilus assembly protein TadD